MISESEWLTRKRRIDGRLIALSWKIVRHFEGISLGSLDKVAVEELPTASGPADYALFVSGKLLGIIEAKKVTVNPQNVLEQAKRYAAGTYNGVGNWGGLRVPFLYASNGEIILHDVHRPYSDYCIREKRWDVTFVRSATTQAQAYARMWRPPVVSFGSSGGLVAEGSSDSIADVRLMYK